MNPASAPLLHRLLFPELPRDLLYRPPAAQAGEAPRPGDVSFRWLGAAGFEVEHRGQRMLLDPYLSRHGVGRTLFSALEPDERAIRERIHGADCVFAGHSHHDHALDVGAISRHTGARVYGSESALHMARVHGAPPQLLHHVAVGDRVVDGPFTVRVLRSVHGKVFGSRAPLPGRIGDPKGPLPIRRWRVGATFGLDCEVAGLRFFHLGSADFLESALLGQGVLCDVLLLCIVGRQGSPGYTERILRILKPKVVLPCHWDDFFLPYEVPARQIPRVDVEGFLEEVRRAGTGTEVALLDYFGEWRWRAQAGVERRAG